MTLAAAQVDHDLADWQLDEAAAPLAAPIAMRASLAEYVYGTYPGEYDMAAHHRLIIEHLEKVERGEIKRLMIFAPPRRGKSELVSVRFPAWCHGRNPDWSIMAFSHTASLAEDFSRQVREQIDDDAWPFPGVRLKPGQKTVKEWGLTGRVGRHFVAGVRGGGTGKGAMLALIDDPFKDDEEARSDVIRERTWRWYWKVVRTRLAPGGRIVLMHTRWHDGDLAGRLIEAQAKGGEEWTVLYLPERAEDGLPDSLGREPGEYIWPNQYPPIETEAIRKHQPETWWPMYQQNPRAVTGGMFKREFFGREYDPSVLPEFEMVVMAVDSSFTEDVANDWSVIAIWGATQAGYYLVDIWRGRVAYPDLILSIKRQYRRWEHLDPWVYIENKASGISAIQTLQRETLIPARAWEPKGSKVSRAQNTTRFFSAGRVWLPAGAEWLSEWVEEHVAFPTAAHDDQVDTTSMAIERLMRAVQVSVDDDDAAEAAEEVS